MIRYFNKEVKFNLKAKRIISAWLKSMIEEHGKQCKDLNIIFCTDSYILEINNQFLNHNYFTDIITFDYCEGKDLSGELYISIDTVKLNAVEYKQEFLTELHRVIVHGVLHLLGYDDHKKADIAKMREAEAKSLDLLEKLRKIQ
ncbi:MAG: rRNA maturation RNase YbeY [Bacteroidales bacterium]